jgi:Ca2+-transporting ATPase
MLPSLGLLWINMLTDTLPGLALALEPTEAGLLDRPPAPPSSPILDRTDWTQVARDGALIAAGSALAAIVGGPLAAFAAIGTTQFGYAATCRSADTPMPRRFGLLVGGSAALHVLAVTTAPVRSLLRVSGNPVVALGCAALGLTAPFYLASRQHVIIRTRKEPP